MESVRQPGSIAAAIGWLRKSFRPDAAAGLQISWRFELSGEAGGEIGVVVDDGRLEVSEGSGAAPDVTLRMSADDFYGILGGRENPDLLFMADRLVIDGDLGLALALRKIFHARV